MQRIGELINSGKSPKSPLSPASDKSRKYDRQLRIWGDHGQYLIEVCSVCLVNADSTGTEILKNLVLAGIGSFTIIDGNKVSKEDDNNFFFDTSSVGKNRAFIACSNLRELNPDVSGDYIEENADILLDADHTLFTKFSVVIVSNLYNEKTLCKLSELLYNLNIPLVLAYSLGFFGLIRLQTYEHPIIESHPDNILEDLRLDRPFKDLHDYLNSYQNFLSISPSSLSRVPFIVILYRFLKDWQKIKGYSSDRMPKNYEEKMEIKCLIRDFHIMLKTKENSTGNNLGESEISYENFEEALKAVNTMLIDSSAIPIETKKILEDPCVDQVLTNKIHNSKFWLLVRALKLFIEKPNFSLPLRGSIPDMTADTDNYVKLQKIYSLKAKEDVDLLSSCLSSILDSSQRSFGLISEEEIRIFARNCHCFRVIRTQPIFQEMSSPNNSHTLNKLKKLINCPDDSDEVNNDIIFYLMVRAVSRFNTVHNRLPGYYADQVESDILILKGCFKDILNELGCSNLSKDDFVTEICRYGGAELHSVSSFIGGCCAQEVIKFITKQFVPLRGTLIYNALSCTTVSYDW